MTLRARVLVIVAVSYISVRESNKRQQNEDCHCDDSKHQWRHRQLAVLDEWSFRTLSKKCKQFVLLEVL